MVSLPTKNRLRGQSSWLVWSAFLDGGPSCANHLTLGQWFQLSEKLSPRLGGEFVLSKCPVVGNDAADLVGLEVGDSHLFRRLGLSGIRQWAIQLPLVRTLFVIVREIVLKNAIKRIPQKPIPALFHRR